MKTVGSRHHAGIPDLLVCAEGQFVAIEVKRPGEKPTALQRAQLEKIACSGGTSAVVTSCDEAARVIRTILGRSVFDGSPGRTARP